MAGRDDYDLRGLLTIGNRALRETTLREDIAGLIEHYRRLDELALIKVIALNVGAHQDT